MIVCYEKVVRISLEGNEILRVHGERTLEAAKDLMNAKIDEPRISVITMVRDFTDVFLEGLLGLPPQRQVEFRKDLVHGVTLVAKSPYRLAPSEMSPVLWAEIRESSLIGPDKPLESDCGDLELLGVALEGLVRLGEKGKFCTKDMFLHVHDDDDDDGMFLNDQQCSRGFIRLADMRQSALCDGSAIIALDSVVLPSEACHWIKLLKLNFYLMITGPLRALSQ
ncbi:hypothetical protein Tco_0618552 [Tanacetum coccineum]